jgi:hypothetical protein
MRKLILLFVGTAVLCIPAVSIAAAPSPGRLATQMCRQIRTTDGKQTFRQAYHSFAGCLKQQKSNSQQDITNAAKTCRTERSTDPVAFKAKYGTNNLGNAHGGGANAFGKCVSAIAKQNAKSDVADSVAAAKTCKTFKSDPTTFQATYGSGKNAFGKCVAQQSNAKNG